MRLFHNKYRYLSWIAILLIAVLFILYNQKRRGRAALNSNKKDRGLFRFDSNTREIQVRNLKGDLILEGLLGIKIDPSYSTPEESTENGLHYTWGDHVILSITKGEKNCLLVDWDSISDDPFIPMDCFFLKKSFWYGGGELSVPSWPVSNASINMMPFYPKLYSGAAERNQHYTSVIEPYWLSSSGVAIYVDNLVPLHVSLNANNDGKLCLKADTQGYPRHQKPVHLKYKLCFGSNVKSTHHYMTSKFFDKPTGPPKSSLMHYPICTLKPTNQKDLDSQFRSIAVRQFPCGSIDLGLQHNLAFDKKTIPDPMSLIKKIQSKKMNVMVRMDSCFHEKSKEYKDIPDEFLAEGEGVRPLNLASNKVVNWFMEKVINFKEKYHLDLLRFCCGEIEFPVDHYSLGKDQNPGMMVHNYVKVSASVGATSDIKVGYKSQSFPLVLRIDDRNPEWGRDRGLRSLIPMVLSISVVGYPFVTIGLIGGSSIQNTKPEKELYIRWMQLSVFFPIMEFNVYPWEYDDDMIAISTEILDIRSTVWDNMLAIAKLSVETGAPLVRPMWWIAPDDPKTYTLNSQFMLGDIYLVAPVLWRGAKMHDVYLPKGVWREMFGKGRKREIEIGRWVSFRIDLKTVVYFECLLCKD